MDFNRSVDISQVPRANIGRSVFDLSHPLWTTFNEGDLIPIFNEDVLPGDSFKIKTDFLARLQTLITPVMGTVFYDEYYFFVPNRLLWTHWQEFCGENKSGYWNTPSNYTEPLALSSNNGTTKKKYAAKSIGDYMGIPTDVAVNNVISALPFRAYCMIWNEYFRDENLQDPVNVSLGDTPPTVADLVDLTLPANILSYAQTGLTAPLKANKYHDVFTSCLPAPQKGPSVSLPIGGLAPVKAYSNAFTDAQLKVGSNIYPIIAKSITGNSATSSSTITTSQNIGVNTTGQVSRVTGDSSMGSSTLHPVFANLGVDLGDGTLVTINDLRLSFATQRYYEALARSGSRYVEILSGLFGVDSPDARLQRPEYLGGSHNILNIEQIVQTSASDSNGDLGDTGAYSLSFGSNDVIEKSFVEHGWIIGVACVRIERNYQQGIPKRFMRQTKFDYYWPQFANIGEVAVTKEEIYADSYVGQKNVFGYQEAWYDYRYRNTANVTGEMRSNYATSLDVWHLADYYSSAPQLSSDWIKEDHVNLDRVLKVQSSQADQVLLNVYFNVHATRPLPVYSIPGGLDFR